MVAWVDRVGAAAWAASLLSASYLASLLVQIIAGKVEPHRVVFIRANAGIWEQEYRDALAEGP